MNPNPDPDLSLRSYPDMEDNVVLKVADDIILALFTLEVRWGGERRPGSRGAGRCSGGVGDAGNT